MQDHARYQQCDSGKNCYSSSKNFKNIVGLSWPGSLCGEVGAIGGLWKNGELRWSSGWGRRGE